MRSDKAYKHIPYRELYDNYKAVFVSADVEHIVLVTDIVRRGEIKTDLRKVLPGSIFSYGIPSFQRFLGVGMTSFFIKFLQFPM